jgi:hypothetical protein
VFAIRSTVEGVYCTQLPGVCWGDCGGRPSAAFGGVAGSCWRHDGRFLLTVTSL